MKHIRVMAAWAGVAGYAFMMLPLAGSAAPERTTTELSRGPLPPGPIPTPKRAPENVKDPEATALVLYAMGRVVKNVRVPNEVDKRVAEALRQIPNGFSTAQRIVTRFEAMSLDERSAILGEFANATDHKFSEGRFAEVAKRLAESGHPYRVSRSIGDDPIIKLGTRIDPRDTDQPKAPRPPARRSYQTQFRGVQCIKSDSQQGQLYALFTMVRSRPLTFPKPTMFPPLEEGDSRSGPILNLLMGPPQDALLSVLMLERHAGTPGPKMHEFDVATAVAVAAFDLNASQGSDAIPALGTIANKFVLGADDHLVADSAKFISQAQMLRLGESGQFVTANNQGDPILYHFAMRLQGESCDYQLYFGVTDGTF